MMMLVEFFGDLIVSGAIVCVIYSLMSFTAWFVCWLIQKLSFQPATSRSMQEGPGAIVWDRNENRSPS